MTNKIALVTGANKGIGYEVARQLGEQGITVLVAARNQSTADETAAQLRRIGMDAVGVELDVTNAEHIAALSQRIHNTYGRLDILVNNAGIWAENGEYEGDAFRDTFEVNTFGPYHLTQALLPLLLKSEAGRIVNQSSALGSIQFLLSNELAQRIATPAYSASKAALNMLTAYWAQQAQGTKLKVNSVHPGLVKTRMGGEKAELSAEDGARTAVRLATLPEDGPTGGFYYMDSQLPW
ncbi:SDR family oxidoreductase [Paenibacillus mucilaginosus]|uniref:Putative short-chain dehydrogenase n=1 Tax=Paenibacillus mucilaginosus (strain KNP414) TaxID=1036673 RepID=F8FR48_PAEMK|nr:SDR family oxidoreductase [Paenibacillus mucilaginosus]AEI40486.1 putative short-chain dehydrogenase [Paenibacillus mucilaginosus KNP414]MCG7213170.1 SDR family oxidoreductase [Paenibacillus mucilaginosus]WDM29660.1 SDR family oxidoreductase [Paenibacillus mucilaginosus]